jgi:hypothetical protein
VLMYALFTEAILIAVASESEQDFEAFCVSLRVTLLLFSVTNAFRYVRTTIEQLIEWALASDAEYIIQAHLLFTFVTDWGKPIWADRFVEWFQHDVRAFTGKLWARGKDHMIRRCMLNIRGMLKQKEHERTRSLGAKPEPGRHTTDHDTADFGGFAPSGSEKAGREELSDVMLNTVDYARATQMWCLGKPLIDTQGPQPMGSFLSLDGKRAALDPAFLNLLTIAEERLTASFDQVRAHACTLAQEQGCEGRVADRLRVCACARAAVLLTHTELHRVAPRGDVEPLSHRVRLRQRRHRVEEVLVGAGLWHRRGVLHLSTGEGSRPQVSHCQADDDLHRCVSHRVREVHMGIVFP